MTLSKMGLAIIAVAALAAGEVNAKGCLAGAAVGGTAGHFAGKHGLIGAGVGCAIGRHRANKKDRAATAAAQQTAPTSSAPGAPAVTAPATTR